MDHDPQAQPLHHQQHHHHHHHGPPQPPQGMLFPPGNSYHHPHHHQNPTNMSISAPPQMIGSNSPAFLQNNRFPFNSIVPTTPVSKPPLDALNPAFSVDAMRPSGGEVAAAGFAIDSAKKKRGRPRKYSPDGGNIALGLSPTPISTAIVVPADSGGGGAPSSETPSSSKKHRGRPPGSGKKQLDALGNCGVGFTPHVILVKVGEDIAAKIMAFAQQGPRTVCIMSANGSICNVTLKQSDTSDSILSYEGRYEIISLTGSFLLMESGGNQVRTGGMSVSLAGPDGRVVGGGVSGMLVAASPVQIVVGSFVANGKKPKYMPSVPESRMLHFGAPSSAAAVTPPSQEEEPSTESSEEDENNNNGNNNNNSSNTNGHLNNISQQQQQFNPMASPQQIHNMQQQQQQQQQMFNPMAWSNPGNTKMHHHQ